MPDEVLLALERVQKRFGALLATDDVSLEVRIGEIHAIIGPNGAGKTTLAAQIMGELRPDSGRIWLSGVDVTKETAAHRARRGLSRSYQIVSIFRPLTVLENVAVAVQVRAGHSYRFWRPASGDAAVRDRAGRLLHEVELDRRAGVRADSLSHGEQRQLELAMTLAGKPRLLVLDEPLAGMGPVESAQVVGLLQTLRHDYGILLVEHDMDAVFALATRISVLVYGRVIASGSPDVIRADPLVRSAYLGDEA